MLALLLALLQALLRTRKPPLRARVPKVRLRLRLRISESAPGISTTHYLLWRCSRDRGGWVARVQVVPWDSPDLCRIGCRGLRIRVKSESERNGYHGGGFGREGGGAPAAGRAKTH